MSEILIPTDSLFTTDDRFIVDNMLTEEDLDLDPEFWAELSSNDSSSCDLIQIQTNHFTDHSVCSPISVSAPETPPSSDRSTPPNFDDIPHNRLTQSRNTLPNVTIVPTMNICPLSPLSPIIANPSSFVAIKSQNDIQLMADNYNKHTISRSNSSGADRLNDCQLRREARKIRNREAASTSRKRKKEYVDSLEQRINDLVIENIDLKKDNERLRTQLNEFENKNCFLAKRSFSNSFGTQCKCRTFMSSNGGSNKKAALSLLAVVFMLGLNLAPFSGVLIDTDKRISSIELNPRRDSLQKHGTSRSLLWNTNGNRVDVDVIAFNSSRFTNDSISLHNCKTYVNQTESLRLESDLRDWLSKVKLEKEEVFKFKKQLKANIKKPPKSLFNKPIPLPRLKAWIQKRTEIDFNEMNDYSLDSGLKIPQINYDDLLSAIHQRDDTFYLLSYSSKDHLIIPPMNRSSSAVRPRFSLLIPLISTLNESLIRGTNVTYSQLSVMQIDCQVINTKMVLFNTSPKTRTESMADINSVRNTSLRIKSKNRSSLIAKNHKKRS